MSVRDTIFFTGNSNPVLATSIVRGLNTALGHADVKKFSDGEVGVEILDHVRDLDVYIIQSTCAPANDNLMELLVLADAARRSGANKIIAVLPYFGYSRQDRRPGYSRVPITSRLVADMLTTVGISNIITCDLHAMQIQGFFNIPVINVSAIPVFSTDVWYQFGRESDVCIVSPDTGGVSRARALGKQLENHNLAIIDKRRPKANVSEVMNIIGDVEDKDCIIFDDIVDTAGTLCKAAAALKEQGANRVFAYCTHGVLSGPAIDNLSKSLIDKLVVTDTIPLSEAAKDSPRVRVVTIAELLCETIRRIANGDSVSQLYSGIT